MKKGFGNKIYRVAFPATDDSAEGFLVFGIGLYLCTVLLNSTQIIARYSEKALLVNSTSSSLVFLFSVFVMLATMLLILGFSKKFVSAKAQKVLGGAIAILSLARIACEVASSAVAVMGAVLAIVMDGACGACSVLFLGPQSRFAR